MRPSNLVKRLLFASTPIAPLGSGLGGGVELVVKNLAQEMTQRGYSVTIMAPDGSKIDPYPLIPVKGAPPKRAQELTRYEAPDSDPESVLARMWEMLREKERRYDLILNFAYDWLPFYLTPYFSVPVLHLVSMASMNDILDQAIRRVYQTFPGTVGFHTGSQASTFKISGALPILRNGFDLASYEFCDRPQAYFCWIGRIAPEKGLEDTLEAVTQAGVPLKIMGALQDGVYWDSLREKYPEATEDYLGFLPTSSMQKLLGKGRALLMTHKWFEAFGNVAVEALACGVPVITYRRGGPVEIIQNGKTGFVVEPDQVPAFVEAMEKIDRIHRKDCRAQAEKEYSLNVWGDRMEAWMKRFLD